MYLHLILHFLDATSPKCFSYRSRIFELNDMDTPEADISAIQSGRVPPLPAYHEHDTGHNDIQPLISTVDPSDTRHLPPSYDKDITDSKHQHEDLSDPDQNTTFFINDDTSAEILEVSEQAAIDQAKRDTISGFFQAIEDQQDDGIALFLSRNLVTANTTNQYGMTPLLAAVTTKNIRIVQQLLDAGAEPDAFGIAVSSSLACLLTSILSPTKDHQLTIPSKRLNLDGSIHA